jgi:tetraacyldisaccharide 4'-kinase
MNLKEALLWPLTLPYGGISHLRARAYRKGILKQRRLDGVVISVGNLTVGGTGKTPMVLWLAEHLTAEGKRVGILTRGYRGKAARKSNGVEAAEKSALTSTSDEVRMLASRLGERAVFGVGADRFACGRELAAQGVDWFILDDGFQHQQLARDADIVLIDATHPFGGGHLLPAGRLREGRSALARADVIVITRSDHAPAVESLIRRDSEAPIFYARTQLDSICSFGSDAPPAPAEPDRAQKLFAFCGIGNPAAFLADLRAWGFSVSGHLFFPDHHRYSRADVDRIRSAADAAGAQGVICTEKDFYNLSGLSWRLKNPLFARISLRIDREDDFWRSILHAIDTRRRAGGLPPPKSV